MGLYEKDTYLNKDIMYLSNCSIYEYDISSAGYNLSKYYNLLPQDKIDILDSLTGDKDKLVKRIGIFQRDDKVYRDALKEAFKNIRQLFFSSNSLEDKDILSIKKDAIFTLRPCSITEFDNVIFKNKHSYSSYYYFEPRIEMYFNHSNGIDVKGISNSLLEKHKDYFLDFLWELFALMENSNGKALKYLMKFINYYKKKSLDVGYYRELNHDSQFAVNVKGIGTQKFDEAVGKEHLNISYNYTNYLIPLLNILF